MSLSYIAGFFDADGYVGLARARKSDKFRYPHLEFTNCDLGILEYIKDHLGGRIHTKNSTNENWNTSYDLRLDGKRAIEALSKMIPHMIHSKKRERSILILENYEKCTAKNGKYTDQMINDKIDFEKKFDSIIMKGKGAYTKHFTSQNE